MNFPRTTARTISRSLTPASQLPSHPPLTLSSTVEEVLREHPDCVHIFDELGIDTCCGGMATLDVAARNVQVVPTDLLSAIRRRMGLDRTSDTPGTPSPTNERSGGDA